MQKCHKELSDPKDNEIKTHDSSWRLLEAHMARIIPMFGFEYCKMPESSFVNFETQPYNVLTEEHHL
jgi:hypothetical protein